ncbi:hypothetical protein DPMN_117932 [Dreissena polymorpha]|uniref:Uncharacterized protein n=1 Tax=Dreissena polymorpha TaxID=45954 RepID=A0A9D4GJ46_DREPO|nr:hypothetical protein DPMN_117932 [Dreissena polymorpha]
MILLPHNSNLDIDTASCPATTSGSLSIPSTDTELSIKQETVCSQLNHTTWQSKQHRIII